jgi:hypothetical protein
LLAGTAGQFKHDAQHRLSLIARGRRQRADRVDDRLDLMLRQSLPIQAEQRVLQPVEELTQQTVGR